MTAVLTCPLVWPREIARTLPEKRRKGDFGAVTVAGEFDKLRNLFMAIGAEKAFVSTNVELTRSGKPRASGKMAYADPGAAMFFYLDDEAMLLQCDRYLTTAENLAALLGHVDMGIEIVGLFGVARTPAEIFRGSKPLIKRRHAPWREVFGFSDPRFPVTIALVRTRYLEALKLAPKSNVVERAFDEAMQELT